MPLIGRHALPAPYGRPAHVLRTPYPAYNAHDTTFYATVMPQILRIFRINFMLRYALATHSLYVYIRSLYALI